MNEAPDLPDLPPLTVPSLGIFWFVIDSAGRRRMLAAGCALAEAEPYGDRLTFGPGHYEIWEQWRRTGAPVRGCAELLRRDEYEDWPRGRIVRDIPSGPFTIYADRRIIECGLAAVIARHFNLPADPVNVEGDFHYQSRRRITPAAGGAALRAPAR